MNGLRTALRDLPDAVFVDVLESDDAYRIVADLPGATPDDVDLAVSAGRLTVEAEPTSPADGLDSAADEQTAGVADEPSAGSADEPAVADGNEPAAADTDEPAAADVEEPAAADVDVSTAGTADEPTTSGGSGSAYSYVRRDRDRRYDVTLPLPPDAAAEGASASLERGVLQVTLPKRTVLGRTDVDVEGT